jgi:hypothetical protein
MVVVVVVEPVELAPPPPPLAPDAARADPVAPTVGLAPAAGAAAFDASVMSAFVKPPKAVMLVILLFRI